MGWSYFSMSFDGLAPKVECDWLSFGMWRVQKETLMPTPQKNKKHICFHYEVFICCSGPHGSVHHPTPIDIFPIHVDCHPVDCEPNKMSGGNPCRVAGALRALPHERQASSWCMLGNDLGPCSHFTPATVEPPHERHDVPHHWRRLDTEIRRERAGESWRGRSWWARGWPPPDFMGFWWESPGSSDCRISWTHHHASPQNAACVVSDKVARPIKASCSWKLPVVWQGP